MRQVVFILLAALMLVSCGKNSEEELNTFVESFNEIAVSSVSVKQIFENEISEIENGSQMLADMNNSHTIYAKYDDNNLTGYRLKIHEERTSSYDAAEIIAEALGLDEENFSASLDTGDATYSDNGYDITIYHTTIDFDKTSQ
ncbi:hypothetical protein [Virgibacillus kimchii]